MEHLEHFGLSRDPFSNETQIDLFFASQVHIDCERRLSRGVQQAKGLCLVTGAPGCGKTMTLRHFFEELDEDHFEACLLVPVPGVSDGDWILGRFAAQLGIEDVARERSEVLAQIAGALREIQERYPSVDLGSYPFFKQERYGTSLVMRGTDEGLLDEMLEAVNRKIPAGRHAKPEEIAALFAFLASDDAAFATGQVYVMDGAETTGGLCSQWSHD